MPSSARRTAPGPRARLQAVRERWSSMQPARSARHAGPTRRRRSARTVSRLVLLAIALLALALVLSPLGLASRAPTPGTPAASRARAPRTPASTTTRTTPTSADGCTSAGITAPAPAGRRSPAVDQVRPATHPHPATKPHPHPTAAWGGRIHRRTLRAARASAAEATPQVRALLGADGSDSDAWLRTRAGIIT